jgi:hypothetical protein
MKIIGLWGDKKRKVESLSFLKRCLGYKEVAGVVIGCCQTAAGRIVVSQPQPFIARLSAKSDELT